MSETCTHMHVPTLKINTRATRVRNVSSSSFFFLPPRDAAPLLWHSRGYEIIFALLILASRKLRRRMEFYRRRESTDPL